MTLKEIAEEAIDEDIIEEMKDVSLPGLDQPQDAAQEGTPDTPVAVTNNTDGTVTYSLEISFDPDMQKKMSKAMPKGMKRDDLADDLSETEEVDEESEEGEGETAEDSAPRGVFAAALDEIFSGYLPGFAPAEDAAPSRHSNTPLENCRAKDPMYCPYHGDKAIKKAIEDNLAKTGVSAYTVTVTPSGKGKYTISVNTPTPTPAAATAILGAFSDSQGNKKSGINLAIGQNTTTQNVGVQVDPAEDRDIAKLDEWMDDLMLDIDADQTLLQELDPKDMRDLFDARDTVSLTPPTVNGQPNPIFEQSLKDARDKYHALRAQIDYRHVKSPLDAKTMEDAIDQHMKKLAGDYHAEKAPVDAAKKAIFPNGRFPNGFAKSHPWASDYNKSSTRVGYFCQKDYDDARSADLNLAPADVKGRRTAISEMTFAWEQYADALDDYKKEVPKFMKEFENWAMNDPSITPAQFKAAFPNSSAKQGATANAPANAVNTNPNSSGKVNLPQSWSNFVMGANRVLPTDGLPNLPYGNEQGFHNVFDACFPKQPVPDVVDSFEIAPVSGNVAFVMNPNVSSQDAAVFTNGLVGAGYIGAAHAPRPTAAGTTVEVIHIPFNANLAEK